MAHKTFISYKYDEARCYRDEVIDALGNDARYYRGETAESPNISSLTVNSIKEKLGAMICDTTVTIVLISPHMKKSSWMEWEIAYSLRNTTRKEKHSSANGLIGVVIPVNGDYSWFIKRKRNWDGCSSVSYPHEGEYVFELISRNRGNRRNLKYACENCKTMSILDDSYISYVTLEDFIEKPSFYIDNAYDKSLVAEEGFELVKRV